MKKLINKIPAFLFSNYFISFIVSVILFLTIDLNFNKYTYKIVEQFDKIKTTQNPSFVDLDSDGFFEQVLIFNNQYTEGASILAYKDNPNALFQMNLKSRLINENIREHIFEDIDNDDYKEIIFCTHKEDSLFLNIIYTRDSIVHKQFFLDLIIKSKFGDYSYNFSFGVDDLDKDLYSEIILNVYGYFSISPRRIYLYNHNNDSIISSNTSGNILRSNLLLSDLNNDGIKDITGFTRAPSNITDQKTVLFSDASSWLMAFNNKLKFLFNPIEEKIEYSTLYTGVLNTDNEKYILYWVTKDEQSENIIQVINSKGEKIDSLIVSNNIFPQLKGIINTEDDYVYLYNDYGGICVINKKLQVEKTILVSDEKKNINWAFYPIDIDKDSFTEYLILTQDANVYIVEEYFNNITEIEIPIINSAGFASFEILENHHLDANLLIQNNEKAFFIRYYKNELYPLRFLTIPLIYVLTFIALHVLTYFQRIQIKRKTEREKELLELQLKTIKNQIEPHFLFNTMTSIGHLIISEDRFEAYNYLESLASLTRKSLEMSDSVAVSLKGEIEFVENYIELQKLRFEKKFKSEIQIDPNVDLNTKLPKMLLQIHVENAIKHGLMNKKTGGVLKISISKKNNKLICIIEDNGIGLEKTNKFNSNSTGKGLEIANQTLELYKKINKIEIIQKIIDLSIVDSSIQGVKVVLNIPI
ncbi:MAG: histidine kinase [Bacteroidales bacterium]|jgi:sensor histidine kinase YesM|nr:histidine kinase [Bacteroidales bacterium]